MLLVNCCWCVKLALIYSALVQHDLTCTGQQAELALLLFLSIKHRSVGTYFLSHPSMTCQTLKIRIFMFPCKTSYFSPLSAVLHTGEPVTCSISVEDSNKSTISKIFFQQYRKKREIKR